MGTPSHITLTIRVRVRVTGDAHIIRVLGMGMQAAKGEIFSFRKQKNPGTRMLCSVLMVCLRKLVCTLIEKKTLSSLQSVLDKRLCLAYVKH